MIRGAAATALAVLLSTSAAAATPKPGLYGIVSRGPLTPVCRVGSPCTGPAGNAPIAFSGMGQTVYTRTDTRGRYRVGLRSGAYTVRADTGIERVSPAKVTVGKSLRHVDFMIDTGIR